MSGRFPPVLRSPPFPWIRPERAAVSMPGRSSIVGTPPSPDTLFARIREARVGGDFWLPVSGDAVDPWSLLARERQVQAHADDELAALASIADVPVRLVGRGRFGKNGEVDREAVVRHLVEDTRYRDPFSGAPVGIEAAIALLAMWRDVIDANHAVGALAGIARWKRREVSRFFWAPRAHPLAVTNSATRATASAGPGGTVAAWPSRMPIGLREAADRAGTRIASVEDGFIRSVGLGSGLHPPQSIAFDRRGVHYDPSGSSDLEHLLQTADFPPDLTARARALRSAIVEGRIAKYGTGHGGAAMPPRGSGRRLVLVPGQVADDLSVRLGGGAVDGNLGLLARTRLREPDAEIWYRPHPDVEAGHRRGRLADHDALRYADRVIRGQTMPDLLTQVDGVSVLTSLTGFEALLRGCDVAVHGAPFYAGWGLTRDLGPITPRRTRRLSLDELVAGALILYPRYLDPVTGLPCPVELLVDRLRHRTAARSSALTVLRALQGRIRRRFIVRSPFRR